VSRPVMDAVENGARSSRVARIDVDPWSAMHSLACCMSAATTATVLKVLKRALGACWGLNIGQIYQTLHTLQGRLRDGGGWLFHGEPPRGASDAPDVRADPKGPALPWALAAAPARLPPSATKSWCACWSIPPHQVGASSSTPPAGASAPQSPDPSARAARALLIHGLEKDLLRRVDGRSNTWEGGTVIGVSRVAQRLRAWGLHLRAGDTSQALGVRSRAPLPCVRPSWLRTQLSLPASGSNFDDIRLYRLGRPLRPRLAGREHEVPPATCGRFRNLEARAGGRGLEAALSVALEA